MDAEQHKIYAAVAANLSLTPVQQVLAKWEPLLAGILTLAQIAAVVITIIYTLRKMSSKKKEKDTTDE